MKKVVFLVIIIILFILSFYLISYFLEKDEEYIGSVKDKIMDNTDVKKIDYLNIYGNNYIVSDGSYIYVFDKEYKEISKVDIILLAKNTNNYDIIYEDELLMYYKDYYKNSKIICEYYDIYKYELVKTISLGG